METKTQTQKATLRALRSCWTCKGLCHENSHRANSGKHRIYFDCEEHARGYYEAKWYDYLRKIGLPKEEWEFRNALYSDEMWERDKERYLEPIDITTPKERGR